MPATMLLHTPKSRGVAAFTSVEYVRADLVTPPQITDAMVDAAVLAWVHHDGSGHASMRAALAAALAAQTKAPGD